MHHMRNFLTRRRPSPAMAVAFVALLAALSGTAVALPGKNTVDSGDLRKNSVKSSDIANRAVKTADLANNAVRSAKVRNNTLTGNDVNESTFGKVPSAANADTAANATNANNANALGGQPAGAFEGARETIPFSFTTGEGERTVATVGPLRVHTNCDLDVGGNDEGEILVSTSADNSTFDDNNGDEFSDWDVVDSPAFALSNSAPANVVEFESTNGGAGAIAAAPGGAALAITNEGVGFNLFEQGDTCYFAGVVVVLGGSAS
jgi:hypothetical protein